MKGLSNSRTASGGCCAPTSPSTSVACRSTHSTVGFLPPDDLLHELDYGRAIHAMATREYATANGLFDALSAQHDAERAPEAAYWWGVSRMRETKQPDTALEPWQRILDHWPDSQWARKIRYAVPGAAPTESA